MHVLPLEQSYDILCSAALKLEELKEDSRLSLIQTRKALVGFVLCVATVSLPLTLSIFFVDPWRMGWVDVYLPPAGTKPPSIEDGGGESVHGHGLWTTNPTLDDGDDPR